eukprot:TRINITY_DN17152_c0_g1_i1.p1 TRINITY_DN17152_c0_g1~~TRINITY_DN17152_c0_g1_i1.p1  ORF type:complete len:234 (+),score=53.97 TRINITY_DN17152_c0_g1_i1:77-703(+)
MSEIKVKDPEEMVDYQRIGDNDDSEQCKVVAANEITEMELSDSEVGTPKENPLTYLDNRVWSPVNGEALDKTTAAKLTLASEISVLRAEYEEQTTKLAERLAAIEEGAPMNSTEADQREYHLDYLRKWMETIVSNVCLSHPTATDVSLLLQDFQKRLRSTVPQGYESETEDEPEIASPDVMSPVAPMQGPSFTSHQSQKDGCSCCAIS